jgi:tetratricopeptide (TPR) repeat protein
MKKLVFASAMALAGICLVSTPAIRALSSSQTIQIQDPAEFNSYQNASTQNDPAQKCVALESFLKAYPQSTAKSAAYDQMIDCYQQSNQPDNALGAATRLLQIDPNNMKAIFVSVYVKKTQCGKALDPSGASTDPQTCDDAAALAQKGLMVPKPADTSDPDWKTLTGNLYPVFHSAIAYDDLVAKKDYASAIREYTAELMLFTQDDCTKPGPCLADTLQLAQAYSKPGPARDEVKAVWFYARAWDYAPAGFKPAIEGQLDYRYKHFHGTLDPDSAITKQINDIKAQAQATLFPPATFVIAPAPTPEELAHHAYTSGDPTKLNLEDIEFILANGSAEDANGLWALLKGKATPVPGNVISDPATVLKVTVTTAASPKPKEYLVKLANSVACNAVPLAPTELKIKEAQAYILANGVKADTDALGDVLTETPAHLKKIEVVPSVTAINVAVTQDAKDNHIADFNVNLKEPLSCKEAPAPGAVLGQVANNAEELDGTYDTYAKVAAAGSMGPTAQIVIAQGFVQQPKKGQVHHVPAKPSAAHHAQ